MLESRRNRLALPSTLGLVLAMVGSSVAADDESKSIQSIKATISRSYAGIAAISAASNYGDTLTVGMSEGMKWEVAQLESSLEAVEKAGDESAVASALAAAETTARGANAHRRAFEAFGEREFTAAARLAEEACQDGAAPSCTLLGYLSTQGEGVAADIHRSISLYTRACDAGFGLGCSNLGSSYFVGRGVAKDRAKGIALFEQGCALGSAVVCGNLALAYQEGEGVAPDAKQAKRYHQLACDGDLYGHCALARK